MLQNKTSYKDLLSNTPNSGVSITLLVSGWFCEVGGCGKKGAVREFIKISMSKKKENIQKKVYLTF